MVKKLLLGVLMAIQLIAWADTTNATKTPDLQSYIKDAESCEHFAGEWYPEMSMHDKRETERKINKSCGSAYKSRTILKKKYKGNSEVLKTLDQYESVNYYSPK